MFQSVEDVQQQFKNARYIANRRISTVVFLAARMGRPVLIEGPAGVGKTELAKTLAEVTGRHLIRLQCYEGLDEGKALYEWKYAKQLLYTQLLKERIGELIADAPSLPDAVAAHLGPGRRLLLPPLPRAAAAAAGDRVGGSGGAAGRRDRQGRAGVRGVSPGSPLRLPGLGARARHDPGHPDPAGRPHLEQRARAVRRPQAAVPAPLHRLPARRRGARDHPPEGPGGLRAPGPDRGHRGAAHPRRSSCGRPRRSRRASTGRARSSSSTRRRSTATWWSPRSPCWSSTRRTWSGSRAPSTRCWPTWASRP